MMEPNLMVQSLRNLNAGNNAVCQSCRVENPDMGNALGPWFCCDPSKRGDCIAFVGKIARGHELGAPISDRLEDVERFGSAFIKTSTWAYWAYTRAIMEMVFGSIDSALPRTCFTNLVKCNNSTTPDTSTLSQRVSCIEKNQFVLKELEAVSPKVVVFYTGCEYDGYIKSIKPQAAVRYEDEGKVKIPVGKKYLPWWSRKHFACDGTLLTAFLRIGHPERMKKDQYTEKVAHWITKTLNSHIPNKAVNWTAPSNPPS